MKGVPEQQIEAIQASGYKASLAVTGGGVGAIHALLQHPGASRFVLEVQVPYSQEAVSSYLGEEIRSCCSAEAAAAMAERAYERSLFFTLSGTEQIPILGIACTAALQTRRDRKGEDRAFFCINAGDNKLSRELKLTSATRSEQDDEVSRVLLEMIADFIGASSNDRQP